MTLAEKINEDLKIAMKAKDKDTLKVVRMLKAALQKEQIEQAEPLSYEQEVSIIAKEMKQRKDSLIEFDKAGRQDLVEPLIDEIKLVEKYLPRQLSEEEVKLEIQKIIGNLEGTEKVTFGAIMSQAMSQLKGQVDGQTVTRIVKEILS